ncbi:MAG: acyltransferase family protein [Halobacteriota archaeon]
MPRLHYLDNIKILLIVIVIWVHAAQPYGPAAAWPITAPVPFSFADILIVGAFLTISTSFFMGLFFFISAYFLPGSFDRKGGKRFLKDRFIRLGIPLIIVMASIIPLIGYLTGTALWFSYLWFIVILIIMALAYSAWRRCRLTVRKVACPGNGTLVVAALTLGAANFIVRCRYPLDNWKLYHTVEPAHAPLYILLIIAGILAYRNNWLAALPASLARLWGIVVVICLFGLGILSAAFGNALQQGGFTLASLLFSFWEAFIGIGICVCALIIFKKRWNTAGRVVTVLAQNVYAVYLLQFPIVLGVQWIFIQSALPLLLQFVLVGAIATALCFTISNYIVRRSAARATIAQ